MLSIIMEVSKEDFRTNMNTPLLKKDLTAFKELYS